MTTVAPETGESVVVRRPGPRELDPVRTYRRRRALELSLAVTVPLLLVLLWQLAAAQGWIDDRVYPAPSTILADGWDRATAGDLWPDVWATLKRVLAGYAAGTAAGYALGLLMGSLSLVRAALEPLLDALYVVPKLALLPIFLNMFGLGEGPQVALVAATVFFFVWISTMSAVLAIPSGHRDAGRVFGASPWQMFRHVLLPASLPSVRQGDDRDGNAERRVRGTAASRPGQGRVQERGPGRHTEGAADAGRTAVAGEGRHRRAVGGP
ncbi:ABC transporter permease [Streptomyces yaanensis]|uniref:ABC transporter permease n=1 Tax=Streptomyces yaanensis TaxID=1142239 RepID=A0ABV7SHH8_9ACTN|nr:ABC transporter permease subunit [Streptomyces sp. CGMCC 4.7035]WNB97668.1 ABC transporter permease subunit [Streptomyces sp. CGMCC 4.7035]